MYSNFITPPDFVDNILVVDATEEQIQILTEFLHNCDTTYNIYMYKHSMEDLGWFNEAVSRANVILQHQDSELTAPTAVRFGEDYDLKNPVGYFNK